MPFAVSAKELLLFLPQAIEREAWGAAGKGGAINRSLAKERLGPELLDTLDTLSKTKKKAKITPDTLKEAHLARITPAVEALDGKVLTDAEVAALPDWLRSAYDAQQSRRLYGSRDTRELDEPFPDGVAEIDFFFRRHLSMRPRKLAAEQIEAEGAFAGIAKALKKVQKQAATLPDGTVVKRQASAPKGLHGVEGSPPFLVLEKDGARTFVAAAGEEIAISRFDKGSHYPDSAMTYEKRSVMERLLDYALPTSVKVEIPKRSESENIFDRFPRGADPVLVRDLLVALDGLLRGGKDGAAIADRFAAADRADTALAGDYAARAGWVEKYRAIAELIGKLGEQSLGDADHTVKIADRFERHGEDADGNETVDVRLEGAGPLLVVLEHAGSVSHAVRLDALEEGVLHLRIAVDGEAPFDFRTTPGGKTEAGPRAAPVLYAVAFDVEHVLEQLREIEKGE